jgi:hypothetical protein
VALVHEKHLHLGEAAAQHRTLQVLDHVAAVSVVLFGEGFGIDKIVGAAILLGGVYLARRQ